MTTKLKKGTKEIIIRLMLVEVAQELQLTAQWLPQSIGLSEEYVSNASRYMIRAECLLQVAEILDCGSVGGFSKGQTSSSHDFFSRWLFLYKKYIGNPNRVWPKESLGSSSMYTSFEELQTVFKRKKQ